MTTSPDDPRQEPLDDALARDMADRQAGMDTTDTRQLAARLRDLERVSGGRA